jgi:hypothetical protein
MKHLQISIGDDYSTPHELIVKLIKLIGELLPENFGVCLLTWEQQTGMVGSESNLPEEYVAALLTSWLEQLPEPASDMKFEFNKH